MADKIPLKGIFDSADKATALAEFEPGDVIPVEHGGTGATNLSDAKTALEIPELGARLENIKANNGVGVDDILSARLANIALNDGVGSDDLISYTLRNIALNDIVQDEDIFDLDATKLTLTSLPSDVPVAGDEVLFIDQFDGLLKKALVEDLPGGGGGGGAIGKQVIGIPAPAFYGGGAVTNPASETIISAITGEPPLAVRRFVTGEDRTVYFQVTMPKSWDGGVLSAKVFFRSLDGDETGDVVWEVEAWSYDPDASTPVLVGDTVVAAISTTHPDAKFFATDEFTLGDVGGAAENSLLVIKVARLGADALDTHAADMGLVGAHIYYITEQPTED
jgi:hypothetical protein